MTLVLKNALMGVPSFDKYHVMLRTRLDGIQSRMSDCSDNDVPFLSALSEGDEEGFWEGFVTQHAPGVFSFPYLNSNFCKALLEELEAIDYEVNKDEPEPAQIPEVVLCEASPALYECLRSLWVNAGVPLAGLLLGQSPERLTSIQAAQYRPSHIPRGHWHIDRDSDVTLVVALADKHTGGGTEIYQGPFAAPISVEQLPTGHALMFNGKANRHYGKAVTQGIRHLLVHWSEIK